MNKQEVEALRKTDLGHQIHPQFHVRDHENAVIFVPRVTGGLYACERGGSCLATLASSGAGALSLGLLST